MATTRVGATQQYAENWDNIFGGGRKSTASKSAAPKSAMKEKAARAAKSAKPAAKKKTCKKAK